ncbi:MAG: SpoIIE family protein phosphatase [Bacteroidetes bacterium]|nr:SpoIIE family protein phosphatase [Bacteroidota bacterium]
MKFTIGRRIGLGFIVFIFFTTIAFVLTILTLKESKKRTDLVVGEVTPSVAALTELNLLLQRSHTDISKWFYNKSFSDIDFRIELKSIIEKEYPLKKEELKNLSKNWNTASKEQLQNIFIRIETLFKVYKNEIMNKLQATESYEDISVYFPIRLQFEDSELSIKTIYKKLNQLIESEQKMAEDVKTEMFKSFNFLRRFVILLGILLIVGGILIAIFTARSITVPVQKLKNLLQQMSLGMLPKERISPRKDEIGDMQKALNNLVQSLNQTTKFAEETGSGNFNAEHNPLSKDDVLGFALIKMRDNLAENERSLEKKVAERTEEVVRKKEEIEEKNKELVAVYKQVTDSIHYAKRLQDAILPTTDFIKESLPNSFVFYKPKDIVSGDFYWMHKRNNTTYFAAIDCTGHGVPGAFMSLIGYNVLKDITTHSNAITPAEMMNKMRDGVITALQADTGVNDAKDGMDMTLCSINFDTLELNYAAAFNPLLIVREGELTEYKADKFPIGNYIGEKKPFKNTTIPLKKGDQIYIFSDGYADQFGGDKGKKFMIGDFKKLLLDISQLPTNQQHKQLETTFTTWKGHLEQVDDILIIGVKI